MAEPAILDGEIPCHRVYEDQHVLAFLDVGPLSKGHTLVIPKERKAFLHELSDESGAALGRALPKIARAVRKATGCEVFHVHFHIIPRVGSDGLGVGWTAGTLNDGEVLAEAIRAAID